MDVESKVLRYKSNIDIREYLLTMKKVTIEDLFSVNRLYNLDFVFDFLSSEELERLYCYDFEFVYHSCGCKNLSVREILFNKLDKIVDVKKREGLKKIYLDLEDELLDDNNLSLYYKKEYQLAKLFYDDKIINNNSLELLEVYKDTFNRDILIKLISNAYGDHVVVFFEERKYLDIYDINNFKVFDKKLYNVLGHNFVNYLLNIDMEKLNYLISKMSFDEKCLNTFKSYFDFMSSFYNDLSINDITNLLEKFMVYEDIISKINFENISEEQNKNLRLLISDIEKVGMAVSSIDDLDNYIEIRKKIFCNLFSEEFDSKRMKNLIFSYVTGRNTIDDSFNNIFYRDMSQEFVLKSLFGEVQIENLSYLEAIKVFNIDKVINDEELIKKMKLTNDEVSVLLLLHEIREINNIEVLKDVFLKIVNKDIDQTILTPVFDKIKKYYINDVKNNILSSSDLDGMNKEVISGVEVINFDKEPFTLLCSVTGMGLSNLSSNNNFSKEELLNSWMFLEYGVGTISTALVSSDTEIYPVSKGAWSEISDNICLVFGNDVDIIAMGASDIMASHSKKASKHTFYHIMDYALCFSTMDELKSNINHSKSVFSQDFLSEVTVARRREDIRKEFGALKRVMPIGLYVIGDISEEELETAKVFNDYYERNGLGKFRIIKVDPRVYKGDGKIVDKNSFEEKSVIGSKNLK